MIAWNSTISFFTEKVGHFSNEARDRDLEPFELELLQNRMHMTSHGHASFDDFLVISKYPVYESYSMTKLIFSVPDLFDVCIERCETAQLECILSCENDLMCLSQCISEATSCIEGIFHFSQKYNDLNIPYASTS